jgi:hypothetical protein
MSSIFINSDELIAAFKIAESKQYVEPTGYKDKIGFTIQRSYPPESKYKPPVTKNGDPDSWALIGVRYDLKRVNSHGQNRVPLTLHISVFSRYLGKHRDYDFEDESGKCPTEESVILSKRTPRPIDLISEDEAFYDHDKEVLINKREKEISGIDLLNRLYYLHIATVDKLKGRIFRLRIKSANFKTGLIKFLENIFKSLESLLCGRTFAPKDPWRGGFEPYEPSDLKLLSTERINVFGYRASKNIVITFCILLLGGYIFLRLFFTIPTWAKSIGSNGLLSISFAICLISALDHFLPKWIFSIVNKLIKTRLRRYDKKIIFK